MAELPGVASAIFPVTQCPDHLPPAGLVGHKKNSLLVDVLTCFRRCVQSLLRVTEVQTIVCLIPHSLSVAERCCADTNSCHNTGFHTMLHAAGLVGTKNTLFAACREHYQSSAHPSPLHLALLPPFHQKKTVFSMNWETASDAP